VPDLKKAIEEFMDAWNENPKPFVWKATVEDIIQKIDRARAKAEQIKPGSTLPRGKKKVANLRDTIRTSPRRGVSRQDGGSMRR
jgi:hypothetical protein